MSMYFSRFFPTPEFLTMKSVGLSITDTTVRFIEFDRSDNRHDVVKKGQYTLPKGVVDAGFITNISQLTDELKKVYDEVGSRFVSVSVPDEKTYVYKTRIPYSENDETIQDSVEATIELNAPLKLNQVIFSFTIINKNKEEKDSHLEVAVSVVPTKVIDAYIAALEGAGFVPVSFELESYAVAHAVIPKDFKETSLIVHIDDEKTGFYVVKNGVVHFSSSLEGRFALVRNPKIIAQNMTSKNVLDHAPAREENNFVDAINMEIDKVYDFWKSQKDESGKKNLIKQIFLCGERAADSEITKKIDSEAPVQVERANVWTNAFSFDEYIPDIPLKDSLGFAAVVGLALSASDHNG